MPFCWKLWFAELNGTQCCLSFCYAHLCPPSVSHLCPICCQVSSNTTACDAICILHIEFICKNSYFLFILFITNCTLIDIIWKCFCKCTSYSHQCKSPKIYIFLKHNTLCGKCLHCDNPYFMCHYCQPLPTMKSPLKKKWIVPISHILSWKKNVNNVTQVLLFQIVTRKFVVYMKMCF